MGLHIWYTNLLIKFFFAYKIHRWAWWFLHIHHYKLGGSWHKTKLEYEPLLKYMWCMLKKKANLNQEAPKRLNCSPDKNIKSGSHVIWSSESPSNIIPIKISYSWLCIGKDTMYIPKYYSKHSFSLSSCSHLLSYLNNIDQVSKHWHLSLRNWSLKISPLEAEIAILFDQKLIPYITPAKFH